MRATAPFNLTRLRKMGATSSSVTMLGGSRKGPAGRLARKIANADQLEIRDRSSRSSAGALMDCDAQRKRPHSAANPAPATLATFKAREMAVEANDLCAIATPRDPNGGTPGERAAARQSCSYQSYCPALGERIFCLLSLNWQRRSCGLRGNPSGRGGRLARQKSFNAQKLSLLPRIMRSVPARAHARARLSEYFARRPARDMMGRDTKEATSATTGDVMIMVFLYTGWEAAD